MTKKRRRRTKGRIIIASNKLKAYCESHNISYYEDISDDVLIQMFKNKGIIESCHTDVKQSMASIKRKVCNWYSEGKSQRKADHEKRARIRRGIKSKKKSSDNFYSSWEWKKLRFEAIKKYGPKCMCCGSEEKIVVDHIKPRSRFPSLELDFNNLQILCNDCNMGKSNDDYTDFRNKEEVDEQERLSKEDIKGISHFNWHESIH